MKRFRANTFKLRSFNDNGLNETDSRPISTQLDENESRFRLIYNDCLDVQYHHFQLYNGTKALLIFHPCLCDMPQLDRLVLSTLLNSDGRNENVDDAELLETVPLSTATSVSRMDEAVRNISNGCVLLLIDGHAAAQSYLLQTYEHRAIEEPGAESTLRGSREGFTEALHVNVSMLRRRLKSPKLKMIPMRIGGYTQTEVLLTYVEGLVNPAMIEEVRRRLGEIETDGILESEYIEEWISDQPYSPFPQLLSTERPDVVVGNLLEGRFSLLVDGTPFALIAPINLFSMLQSVEDYYQQFWMSTFVRWMRYTFYLLSLLLPSLYIAITTYHQEMVPTVLLLSIAKAREEIPFPALVEALIMEIAFEALREAGVRLPKQVGAAVSIVGALIIGQAATTAGIVSAPMVIVVAATGIASFMIPRYTAGLSSRLLRFPLMVLSGTLGLIGTMLGVIVIVIHLCSLRSFGMPYLSPMSPASYGSMTDVLWRAPLWRHSVNRPSFPIEAKQLKKK